MQLPLFDTIANIYRSNPDTAVSQQQLYQSAADSLNLAPEQTSETKRLKDGSRYNVFQRDCRWVQQQLKAKGLLERVDKGMWQITKAGKDQLTEIQPGYVCLAFSTDLGVCLWGDAKTVGKTVLEGPVHLILTSPPYFGPSRNYGTYRDEKAYVRFLVEAFEPFVNKMAPGAGLVLNIGNDMFEKKRPVRSVCLERLIIELHDALGLSLVERLIWKTNKVPGPTQWAFIRRFMLRSGFEFTFCFTNEPEALQWDNRHILEEHDEKYLHWCQNGGQKEVWQNSTYRKKAGAYSGTTEKCSRIPTNILSMGHRQEDTIRVKRFAKLTGLPEHTAMFPRLFAEFFIRWMTVAGNLVTDPFGGTLPVAEASESLGRHWLSCDKHLEFPQLGASRFSHPSLNHNLHWPGLTL